MHALNIIKRIVNDGSFSLSIQPFLSSVCIAAVNNFGYNMWAVRNSAVMVILYIFIYIYIIFNPTNLSLTLKVFSAMMKRATGTGANQSKKMSSSTFFSNFPLLFDFLLSSLSSALSESVYSLHPALFPILLLISRLKPLESSYLVNADGEGEVGEGNSGEREGACMDAFIPVVSRTLSLNHWKIRQMSAEALAAMVFNSHFLFIASFIFPSLSEPICQYFAFFRLLHTWCPLIYPKYSLNLRVNGIL